jgi:hypothetical protein
MQITGILKVIRNIQQISEKFQKREFVITTQEQYPQFISLELQGDKCDIIDAYVEGEEVTCDLNLRGREWVNPHGETKYFNTIVCWKIQRVNSQSVNPTNSPNINTNPKEFPQANQSNSFVDEEDFQDLPF